MHVGCRAFCSRALCFSKVCKFADFTNTAHVLHTHFTYTHSHTLHMHFTVEADALQSNHYI